MKSGLYKTEAGSELQVYGKYENCFKIWFDWVEEKDACFDCEVDPHPKQEGEEWKLIWSCKLCGGGEAVLYRVPKGDVIESR